MSGEAQYREQAKKQWEKLDAEGCKIINDLILADKDRTIWPENTEPKFTGKKGAKLIKVAFNTKSKKYMHTYEEKEEVPVEEAIRLDIPDAHIYFCFHPTKNEYVVIDTPNRQEPDTKYIITAPLCHWIREKSITVSVLLSYAIRITHSARRNLQKAIKNTPSEEILQKKIAEQECYTELVDIILGTITDLSDVSDLSKNHETYVDKINSMINCMHERGIKPGCKTLTRETKFSDFTYAEDNAETMNSARDIINSKMNGDELIKQWKTNHDGEIRAKNQAKQREIWEKWWGEFLTPHREQKDPEMNATISMGYCEVRGPKPQLLVFINFTLISHSELKINLDVHPSWVLSLLSSLIDIVVSTSLFR